MLMLEIILSHNSMQRVLFFSLNQHISTTYLSFIYVGYLFIKVSLFNRHHFVALMNHYAAYMRLVLVNLVTVGGWMIKWQLFFSD
jgi:hypothetical protein